jgi:hypothetical protein
MNFQIISFLYKIRVFLLYLIGISISLGEYARFFEFLGQNRGLSFSFSVVLIFLTLIYSIIARKIFKVPGALYFIVFLNITAIGALSVDDNNNTYNIIIQYLGYLTVTYCVYALNLNHKQILIFVFLSVASLVLSLLVAQNYPNLIYIDTSAMEFKEHKLGNFQGHFSSRTSFSSHAIMAYALSLGMLFYCQNKYKFFWLVLVIILLKLSFESHSRSLFLGEFIILLYFSILNISYLNTYKLIIGFAIFITIILSTNNPMTIHIMAIIENFQLEKITNNSGDLLRMKALTSTWADLQSHFFGMGFSRINIEGWKYPASPHNNFVMLLRAGGFLGFAFAIAFLYPIFILYFKKNNEIISILLAALLGWSIIGLAHVNFSSILAWIIFGMILSLKKQNI